MKSTVLNPSQLHILEMLSFARTEEAMTSLKKVLADFYAKRVENEVDEMWNKGLLNDEKLDDILHEHLRTPYK